MLQLLALAACGGGGVGAPATVNSNNQLPNGKMSLVLTNSDGSSANSFEAGKTFIAKVIVTGTDSKPAANTIVTFSVQSSLAVISPISGTALTDAKGEAQVTVEAGTTPGATNLVALAKVANATESLKSEVPFAIKAGSNTNPPEGKISLYLLATNGAASTLLEGANVLIAKAVVVDQKGMPAPNLVVSFAVDSAIASLLPATGTALTNADGIAIVTIKAGVGTGAASITARTTVVGTTQVSAKLSFAVNPSGINNSPDGKIQLNLIDAKGVNANVLSSSNTLVARAIVLNEKGLPAQNVVVNFGVDTTIATLQPSTGTALTNADGVAVVNLKAGIGSGAGTVSASASVVGATPISAKATFAVSPNSDNNSPEGKIQLSLLDLSGAPANLVSGTNVLTARAVLVNQLGLPAANVVVTYSLDSAIATLLPVSGTALTDANGVATLNLKAGSGSGAGTLTATANIVGAQPVSSKASFQVGSPVLAVPAAVNFVSAIPADNSIVIQGSGGNGRTEIALLQFKVVDSTNVGVANTKVNFSVQSSETVSLVANSAITDGSGIVTAAVRSGTKPTTLRVVTTVDGMSINAISDSVTVTTGLPTQTHFGLYVENLDVEGYDFGGTLNLITVLLADANGGVVANGTPVVFTVDSGAIVGDKGTADNARCITVNGKCQVLWRSQAPSKSEVTVVATTTDGSNTLTASARFINSASTGSITGVPSSVTFTAGNCVPQLFNLVVSDRYGYTMPTGTALTLQDPTTVSGSIFSSTVTAPFEVIKTGTNHTLSLSPLATCPAGSGHVFVQMKSPLGVSSSYRIDVIYN